MAIGDINVIFIDYICPKEIMDTRANPEEYRKMMEEPYRESVMIKAKEEGLIIGEIKRHDYGLQPAEIINDLEEGGVESYWVRFYAHVLN